MQLSDRHIEAENQVSFNRRFHNDYRRLKSILLVHGKSIDDEPTLDHLLEISKEFNIDIDLLIQGNFNFHALEHYLDGDVNHLPEKYCVPEQLLSRGRSVLTIMNSIEYHLGSRFHENVLRRLQITPSKKFNPDEFVSLQLIVDLLSEVRRVGMADSNLRWMGLKSAEVNKNSALGEAIRAIPTASEVYRSMHEEWMHFFDKNWKYEITYMDHRSVDVKVTVREETQDAYKNKKIGSREGCLLRQGIYASMIVPVLNRPATIQESRCMHVEGDHCMYHLKWN